MIPLRDDNPTTRTPLLTLGVIAANVLVYFFVQPQTFAATTEIDPGRAQVEEIEFLYRNAAIPCEVRQLEPLTEAQILFGCDAGDPNGAGGGAQPYPDKNVLLSALASMFMHGGLLHLGGNMLFLWVFGNNIEDRFGYVGYVLFYLFTGVAATAAHVVTNLDSTIPLVGASGAIAGVMGAYLVFFPKAHILSLLPLFVFVQLVRLPAGVVLGLWFVLQFFTNPNSGVAWAAHVGGFVVGAAIAFLARSITPRTDELQRRSPA